MGVQAIRPDQFNFLLGYCGEKIGPTDRKKRKKAINWGMVIDHNLIKKTNVVDYLGPGNQDRIQKTLYCT